MKAIPYEDFTFLASVLQAQDWIYAKTMPQHPHWYTLRKRWRRDADFERAVTLLRTYGYDDWFYRKCYTAFNVNGDKYWTMGAPLSETILINRKPHREPAAYDEVADRYDALFTDAESLAENAEVMSLATPRQVWRKGNAARRDEPRHHHLR